VKVFISTGEVSGDLAAARLIDALYRRDASIDVCGIGGRRMKDAGAEVLFFTANLGTVGITEVFANLISFFRAFLAVRRRMRAQPADVAVLIGNDGFNVLLARWLRGRGIRTVAYFPPQVWIWRALAGGVARSFDVVLASFPEEEDVYRRAGGIPPVVRFVGHYLAGELEPSTPAVRAEARTRLGLSTGRVVALLPGSRNYEVGALTPVLLDAAQLLLNRDPTLRYVLPVADALDASRIHQEIARRSLGASVAVVSDGRDAMRAADLVLLSSGTATLEATLLDVPMVIVYKVSAVTYVLIRAFFLTGILERRPVGLPNLILGREAVTELLQSRLTARTLADEAWSILGSSERRTSIRDALCEVRRRVSTDNCLQRVATAIVETATAPVDARHAPLTRAVIASESVPRADRAVGMPPAIGRSRGEGH
jgi:lipid-A-disaccharide synthase